MFDTLTSALGSNQLLSGGVALALLGVAAMWLRDVPGKFAAWAKHFLVTTLTVDSREELMFPALVEYMDSRDALRRLNNFTVRAVRSNTSTYQSLHDELQQGGKPATVFSPGEGFHIFVMDGRLMWMKREVQVGMAVGEKITLSTLGRDKVDFTRIEQDGVMRPVQGMRGVIERNVMCYQIAMDTFLTTQSLPATSRHEAALKSWFEENESYQLAVVKND